MKGIYREPSLDLNRSRSTEAQLWDKQAHHYNHRHNIAVTRTPLTFEQVVALRDPGGHRKEGLIVAAWGREVVVTYEPD